jgi:hypothetical protein
MRRPRDTVQITGKPVTDPDWDPQELTQKLAHTLPQAIDGSTPEGGVQKS